MARSIVLAAAVAAAVSAAPADDLPTAWLAAAGPGCRAAFTAQLEGRGQTAARLWAAELALSGGQPCPYAHSLAGIALVRSGSEGGPSSSSSSSSDGAPAMAEGLRHLAAALAADSGDWVAASYLGASYELLARRLAASTNASSKAPGSSVSSGAYLKALERSAAMFSTAATGRRVALAARRAARGGTGVVSADDRPPHYPPAWFAQPPTYLYRSWGGVLLWLGRPAAARAVFEAGVAEGIGWRSHWARPADALPLALRAPAPFFDARPAGALGSSALGPLLRALEAGLPAVRAEFRALRGWGGSTDNDSSASSSPTGAAAASSTASLFTPEAAGLHAHSTSAAASGGNVSSATTAGGGGASWSVLPLYVDGAPQARGCAAAPATCRLLASLPLAHGVRSGQAKFSVMAPGTHVLPHAGPTNARLRVHCTLSLLHGGPAAATFRVGPETRHWADGECFAFDESFEHEVTTWGPDAVQAAAAARAAAAGNGAAHSNDGSSASGGEASAVIDAGSGSAVSDEAANAALATTEAAAAAAGLRGPERAVLLVDVPNPYLAALKDYRAAAVSDAAAADPRAWAALEAAWRAAQAEVAALGL